MCEIMQVDRDILLSAPGTVQGRDGWYEVFRGQGTPTVFVELKKSPAIGNGIGIEGGGEWVKGRGPLSRAQWQELLRTGGDEGGWEGEWQQSPMIESRGLVEGNSGGLEQGQGQEHHRHPVSVSASVSSHDSDDSDYTDATDTDTELTPAEHQVLREALEA
jgi:hypothetical protein